MMTLFCNLQTRIFSIPCSHQKCYQITTFSKIITCLCHHLSLPCLFVWSFKITHLKHQRWSVKICIKTLQIFCLHSACFSPTYILFHTILIFSHILLRELITFTPCFSILCFACVFKPPITLCWCITEAL